MFKFRKPKLTYIIDIETIEDIDNVYALFRKIIETQGGFKLKIDLEDEE